MYTSMAKDVKNKQLFMDLYVGTIMDVKKINYQTNMEYYNGCKKTSNYLQKLYAGITMDVKNQ